MSQTETSTVLLEGSQIDEGAALLARVMEKAPDMTYFIGDDRQMHSKKALRFYRAVINAGMRDGAVYTTPEMAGLAIWLSPENAEFTLGSVVRSGFLGALVRMGVRPMVRFVRSSLYVERLQKQAITRDRWVLVFLAVETSKQGQGIGGKLIGPVLERADREGLPCYVESADERNLSFYLKHNFAIVQQGQVPNGGPRVWIMVREPRVE